ncbi:MAG: DUF4893 domain-containing protein [Sphingomicrobium sp.]
MSRRALMLAFVLLGGCGGGSTAPQSLAMPGYSPSWREMVSDADRERLRGWRSAFADGVAAARRAGHSADIDREGALLDPDGALAEPAIPDGRYRCRVTKLGAKSDGLLDYIAYPAFSCVVGRDGSLQRLDKVSGSQRYVGLIFPGDAMRQVFLGTLVLGDEARAMQYKQDETRNIAGHIERIGPSRWRLVMPNPHFESLTDVMELVPEQ